MPFFDDDGADMPWLMWKDPAQQWEEIPSFLIIEYVVFAITIACFVHASANGFTHTAALFMAMVGGCWTDVFSMMLPKTDCFWQAQATIMLTPRLPLYIPCIYVVFGYIPMVASMRLGWGWFGKACFSGIVGRLIYAPYDIAGAVFLWWTWHDSDQVLLSRNYAAPAASTAWTIVHCFLLSLMWQLSFRNEGVRKGMSASRIASVLFFTILLPIAMTVIMMIVGLAVERDFQVPTYNTLFALDTIGVAGILYGYMSPVVPQAVSNIPSARLSGFLSFFIFIHCVWLASVFYVFNPEDSLSVGIHQTLGPCWVETPPLLVIEGANTPPKYDWTCEEQLNHDDYHQYNCERFNQPHPEFIEGNQVNNQWYAVCGRPLDRSREEYFFIELFYATLILILTTYGIHANTKSFARPDDAKKTQ